MELVCVQDFEEEAFRVLDKNALEYFMAGADDEITLKQNTRSYERYSNSNLDQERTRLEVMCRWSIYRLLILPRVLRDVAVRNLSVQVFGKPVSVPIGVSPAAFQKMSHADGELGNAKAAAAMGSIFCLSYFATTSLEEIATAIPHGRKWLQTYVHKDRSITKQLIRRAEAAGFEAIVFTVDCQAVGKRRADRRRPLVFPSHLSPGNATKEEVEIASGSGGIAALHKLMDFGTTWEIFKFFKR